MKYGFPWQILVAFGAILTLAGCSDSSISSRDIITPTYLFYTTGGSGDYGIHAIDPSDPGNPTAVESVSGTLADFPTYFLAGTVESGSKTIADLHYRYLLYPLGTNFYKVSALKSEALVKQQVSSESAADTICDNFPFSFDDYNDPEQSVLFYTVDPVDTGACDNNGNDILYMIKMGMSSATGPLGGLVNYAPISAVYDSTGAITGFLVQNLLNGNIELRDTSLASPSIILSGIANGVFPAATDSNGRMVLSINNTDLYVFNPLSGTISASLHTDLGGLITSPMPIDSTHAYFRDGEIIYRIPMDASANATVVVDESGGAGSLTSNILLSRGRIIYLYEDTPNDFLRSVSVSGGTGTNIYTLPDNPNIRSFRAAAGRVYLSAIDGATRITLSVGDSGSNPEVTLNAWWSGFTFHPRQPLFADIDLAGRLLSGAGFARLQARAIYQVNYSPSGNTLTSYDADTTSKLVDFGVPSADFDDFTIDLGFFGIITFPPVVHGLANNDRTYIVFDGAGGSKDIISVHARNGGSVVRVTNDGVDDNYFGIIGGCTLGKGRFDPVFPLLLLLSVLYLWRRRNSYTPMR